MSRAPVIPEFAYLLVATADVLIKSLGTGAIHRVNFKCAIRSKLHDPPIYLTRTNFPQPEQPLNGGLGMGGIEDNTTSQIGACRKGLENLQ